MHLGWCFLITDDVPFLVNDSPSEKIVEDALVLFDVPLHFTHRVVGCLHLLELSKELLPVVVKEHFLLLDLFDFSTAPLFLR